MITLMLLLISSLCYTPSTAFLRQFHRMQVRIAAQHFASDVRKLQQSALFSNNINDCLTVLTNNEGYYLLQQGLNQESRTTFEQIGCEGVYFKKKLSSLRFSEIGSPNITGNYELRHEAEGSFACVLTLQVASGRLDINETE